MFFKLFQGRHYTIRAFITIDSETLSFDRCFEIDRNDLLPKSFRTRNGRTFTKTKLRAYESIVHRVQCDGNVTFTNLKKHMPTLFDFKTIRSLNSMSYLRENMQQIVSLGSAIIGEEKTKTIIRSRLNSGH